MYKRYRFFHDNAGYIVGHAAECALTLARAEALLDEAEELGIAEVKWPFDDEPYEHGCMTDDEVREQFENNRWTGPFGCVVSIGDDEHAASLWGIVFGSQELADPHARVIRAELASELAEDLMQAIGDAKDAQLDPLT